MSIIQVVGSGGTVASNRTSFVGARVPPEVKAMVKPLSKLDKDTFRKILKMIVTALSGEEINLEQWKQMETETLTEEVLTIIFSGLLKLLQCGLRLPISSLKPEHLKEDLAELQVPEEFQSDIASAVMGSRRTRLEQVAMAGRPRLPGLETFKWRVDVAISTSVLNRVLEPTILMEMTLSNGKIHNFEVPVSKFHELRYNVAFVLKEMEDLEKRSILKIQD